MRILLNLKHPILAFCIVILVGCLGAIFLFELHFQNRFFSHTILGGQDVSNLTYTEVREHAQRVAEALQRDGVQIVMKTHAGEKTVVIPQQSTGLTPDVVVQYFSIGNYLQAIDTAFEVGHRGTMFERLKQQIALLRSGYRGGYNITVRADSIASLLDREITTALPQPRDARLVATAGGMTITPEQAGEGIAADAVLKALTAAVEQLSTNRLQATVTTLPAAVSASRLAVIKDFAASLASGGLFRLNYNATDLVYVGGSRLASWLTIDPAQAGVVIKVLQDPLQQFVSQYVDGDLEDAPRNSRFAMQRGVLVETVPGQIGSVVDIAALKVQLEAVLNARYVASIFSGARHAPVSGTTDISISFKQVYPTITSTTISEYNITQLIGSATTSFKGSSADRIHNITLGVERAGGVLIAPGAEFSLVKAIGDVSEESGFAKEYVIKGDRSIKEAGGGLCQVATTVFRGVLDAGLPITERQAHSYVVGYYGPGLDATIYGPHPDLKFINDTSKYILFQMRVEGTNLISEFYGTRDGRTAETTQPVLSDYIDPPPDKYIPDPENPWGQMTCTDHPRKGVSADATSTITYADGSTKIEEFHSVYQPWPKICLVGIKLGISK